MGILDQLGSETGLIGMAIGVGVASLTSFARTIAPYEWKRWREGGKELEEWYNEAEDMVSKGLYIGFRHSKAADVDYQEISSQLDPLAERLIAHVNKAPEEVEEDVINALSGFAAFCTSLASMVDSASQREGSERLTAVVEMSDKMGELPEDEEIIGFFEEFSPGEMPETDLENEDEEEIDYEVLEREFEKLAESTNSENVLTDLSALFELDWGTILEEFPTEFVDQMVEDAYQYYFEMFLINYASWVNNVIAENK